MGRVCEISACIDVNLQPVTCLDVELEPVTCLDLCIAGEGLNIDDLICDISFIDYEMAQECTLSIDSVNVDGAAVTVNASGGIGGVLYRFVDDSGSLVQNWSTSNSVGSLSTGKYFVQVRDGFGCGDFEEFEVV